MAGNTVATTRPQLTTEDLDASLYSPLTELLSGTSQFERVYEPEIQKSGIDVILTENSGHTSYIAEKPVWHVNAKSFPFEVSYEALDGYVDAGWFLDIMKKNDFFMVYSMDAVPDELITYHAMLIARQKLFDALYTIGYDRMAISVRDELIRKSGRPGIYSTACPDISFRFQTISKAKPIYLMVQTEFLAKIATADLHIGYDRQTGEATLSGQWLGRRIVSGCFA